MTSNLTDWEQVTPVTVSFNNNWTRNGKMADSNQSPHWTICCPTEVGILAGPMNIVQWEAVLRLRSDLTGFHFLGETQTKVIRGAEIML